MKLDQMLPKSVRKAIGARLKTKERVLFALPGFFILRSKGRWTWPVYFGLFHPPFLMSTNKRLIIVAKGWFRTVFYAWELQRISRAGFAPGRFVDKATLTAGEISTHILCPRKLRKATKQLVDQIWLVIGARKRKRRRTA